MKQNKLLTNKMMATGMLVAGGLGFLAGGIGYVANVSAAPAQASTSETAEAPEKGMRGGHVQLTDEQKTKMENLKNEAIASLSSEDQATLKTLEAKGHFSLTFAERDQLKAIKDKIMAYVSAHPVEGLPTPPADKGTRGDKSTTLTDAQKTELDTLKAEGIAQLTATEQARLKELDTKDRKTVTEAERTEMKTLTDKVMTYVKSKVSFTMPEPKEGKGKGHRGMGDAGEVPATTPAQ